MKANASVICAALWRHQDIETNGDIQDCCASLPGRNEFNINTHSLNDEWNSERKKTIRMQMLRGEQPESCWWCYDTEKRTGGHGSVRSKFNQGFLSTLFESELQETWDNNGAVSRPAEAFQVQTGNLCNLACKMCRPALSTSVGKFYKKHFDTPAEVTFVKRQITLIKDDPFDLVYDWPTTNKIANIFSENVDDIKTLYITGGEPTIIKENIEFLKHLADTGRSKKIHVRTNTNCTNINKEFLDAMSQFRNASIAVSIDGIDEIAYIQRHPSHWPTIDGNLDKIGKWFQLSHRHAIDITTVITNLNVHHVLDAWAYLCDKFKKFNVDLNSPALFNICWQFHDSSLGVGHVPKPVMDEIINSIPSYRDRIPKLALDEFEKGMRSARDNAGLTYRYIFQVLDKIQDMHPELNIKKIYEIYYKHLP